MSFSLTRSVVECAFGIMVSKFRCLNAPLSMEPANVDKIVLACCLLHNIIIDKEGSPYTHQEVERTATQFRRFSCAIWFGKKFFFTIQTRSKWIDGILLERGKNSITAILLKQTIDAVIVWYNYGMNDIYLYWNICRYLSFAVVVSFNRNSVIWIFGYGNWEIKLSIDSQYLFMLSVCSKYFILLCKFILIISSVTVA